MAKLKILVVEDDHFLAEELCADLEDMGYQVLPYQTESQGAFAVLKSEKPDVVLMDIELDGSIDGIDLTRLINAHFNIPIIYMTATHEKYLSDIVQTNHSNFLIKPFHLSQLKVSIERAILMLTTFANEKGQSNKIFVKQGESYVSLMIDDILYVEAKEWESLVSTVHGDYLIKVSLAILKLKLETQN